MVAANARTAITFALSPGQASDAVEGRKLLGGIGPLPAPLHLVMDGAYEDNQTLQLAPGLWFHPGGSTPTEPLGALGVRPSYVPQTQRD